MKDIKKLFLIDAHALCYKAFFAIKEFYTSKGQPTNAVYGFVNILNKLLREYKPEFMAACFDSPKKTYRKEKYSEYKIQRPSMPQGLRDQIAIIKDVVRAYNIPVCEMSGFEADDIIATFVNQAGQEDLEVVIVSEDKDMYQLVSDKVKVLSTRNNVVLEFQDVKKRLGFEPERIVDFIALAGDKTDNIPGVAGIGDVTARKLINEFGDLENILDHLDNVTPVKVKEKIENQRELAILSKELAVLSTQVPFSLELPQLKVEEPDNDRLFDLFKQLEFKKFADELKSYDDNQLGVQIHNLEKKEDILNIVAQINQEKQFCFLLEHDADPQNQLFQKVYLSFSGDAVYTVPLHSLSMLKALIENEEISKITFDVKENYKPLLANAISLEGKIFDVKLAGYLLSPGQTSSEINDLAWNFLKYSIPDENQIYHQTLIVQKLYKVLQDELKAKKLIELFENIEIPLAKVLLEMESLGVTLDVSLLKKLSAVCADKIEALSSKLYAMAGEEFNLNSSKQLSKILFEKLQLPVIKKTKTGFSTDEGVLTKLAQNHAFPKLILEYRQLAKLKSTYIDALPKLVKPETKRIHARFNQTGTETGRLSSSHPNLQNIPIKTEMGQQIRKAIIPSKGRLLLSADYSQIELRILAHLSKDETLIGAFERQEDIHNYTASLIYDVKEDQVTKQMRDNAKRVNFGIVYGMSSFGLSKDLNIPPQEAQDFIDKYFLRYPKVKKYMDRTILECEESGYVLTILNRRRYIPEINSSNGSILLIKVSEINIGRKISLVDF